MSNHTVPSTNLPFLIKPNNKISKLKNQLKSFRTVFNYLVFIDTTYCRQMVTTAIIL
jgi:hypothetical protein